MVVLVRGVLVLLGALFVFLGGTFLLDPVGQGGDFGLTAKGNQGLSTIRADMTAFFWVSGGAFLIGAWKQRGDVLLVTAALMGITLAGRAVSIALDGPYEGWQMPMAVEALTVVVALFGARILPRPSA